MRASNSVLSSARSLLLRNCTCNLDAAAILQQSRGICGFVGASKEDGPSSTSATVLGTSVFRAAALSVPFSAARLLSTSSGVADSKLDLASKVLEQATVLTLREELDVLGNGVAMIPFSEFARLSAAAGCSRTDNEASELCNQLQKACIVLRHKDSVYLRPEEIAEAVMMMMPSNKTDAERTLLDVEEELKGLEHVHNQLEEAAQRRTNAMLSMGLVVLCSQFVIFYYLTWWELSWDVMEPIGYMISLFYSICAYVYFLGTKGSQFDLGPFKEFWSKRILNSRKAKLAFDQERWDFLVKQRERIRKHLGLSHQVMRAITKH